MVHLLTHSLTLTHSRTHSFTPSLPPSLPHLLTYLESMGGKAATRSYSGKKVFWNLWWKPLKNTFEEVHFFVKLQALDLQLKWAPSKVFLKYFDHRLTWLLFRTHFFQNTYFQNTANALLYFMLHQLLQIHYK